MSFPQKKRMRVLELATERKPRALALMAWILEMRPSVTALAIGCRRQMKMFSRWRLIMRATAIIGLSCARLAQPNHSLKNFRALPS